jgi:hypothetical protein
MRLYFRGVAVHLAQSNRLLKNCFRGPQSPSAAEQAATDFAALTARLEAAPFQNMNDIRVFQRPAKDFLLEKCRRSANPN